jgi:hypothetical protein
MGRVGAGRERGMGEGQKAGRREGQREGGRGRNWRGIREGHTREQASKRDVDR